MTIPYLAGPKFPRFLATANNRSVAVATVTGAAGVQGRAPYGQTWAVVDTVSTRKLVLWTRPFDDSNATITVWPE